MARRMLAAVLGVLVLFGAMSWGVAGEKERKPPKKQESTALSAEEYDRVTGALLDVASKLDAAEGDAAVAPLREQAERTLKDMKLPGKRTESILGAKDPKDLAAQLRGTVANSIRGKIAYARRQFIESNAEMGEAYKAIRDKQKQLEKELTDFYAKIRTMSPEIDRLEKRTEELEAAQKKQADEKQQKPREGRGGKRRKEEQ